MLIKFMAHNNIPCHEFCLRNESKDFTKVEVRANALNGAFYDFSTDHSAVEKEDILNIDEYSM